MLGNPVFPFMEDSSPLRKVPHGKILPRNYPLPSKEKIPPENVYMLPNNLYNL